MNYLMKKRQFLGGSKWYLPGGITEADTICAFQFIGRESEGEAIKSVNETEYTLSKGGNTLPTWTAEKGFYFPGTMSFLQNNTLNGFTPVTVIGRYAECETGSDSDQVILASFGTRIGALCIRCGSYQGSGDTFSEWRSNSCGVWTSETRCVYDGFSTDGTIARVTTVGGYDLYRNGELKTQTVKSGLWGGSSWDASKTFGNTFRKSSASSDGHHAHCQYGHYQLLAVSAYSVALTATQIAELTDNMGVL